MAINKKWSRLDQVPAASDSSGIYEFGHHRFGAIETVYIGRATGRGGLRARISQHVSGTGNPELGTLIQRCPALVVVRWEAAAWLFGSAINMEVNALKAFVRQNDRLPRYNSRLELSREGILGALEDLDEFVSS